jgi:hypothetical protein
MQFRAAQVVQVSGLCPAQRPASSDRDCPLDTAGDRCLWHVGGTAGENDEARAWRRRLQLGRRVRTVPVTSASLASVPSARQLMFPEWRTSVGRGPGQAEISSPRQTVEASPGGAGLVLHLGLEVIVAEQVIDGNWAIGARPGPPLTRSATRCTPTAATLYGSPWVTYLASSAQGRSG